MTRLGYPRHRLDDSGVARPIRCKVINVAGDGHPIPSAMGVVLFRKIAN